MKELAVSDVMFSLLRFALWGGEALSDGEREYTARMRPWLYALSKSHDIAHLVGHALASQGLLGDGDEVCRKFERDEMLAVFRYEKINYELSEVCRVLEEAEISFVPLKGAVMRRYYPDPWMRTSCDIDILVNADELERAAGVLTDGLGYAMQSRSFHDISFNSPSGVHLELHHDLVEDGYAAGSHEILSNAHASAVAREGHRFLGEFDDATFYFYHVAHMAKHVEHGGCGVRPFIDLLILDRLPDRDVEGRDALLERGGLLRFAETARALSRVWLEGEEHTSMTRELGDYILGAGVYGSTENRVAIANSSTGNRFVYLMKRIFLPE